MRSLTVGTLTVLVLVLSSPIRAEQQTERETTDPQATEEKAKESQKTQSPKRREPVKVVDIAPETATHLEGKPLAVEFKRITALRMRPDDTLLACDGDAKVIKVIDAGGQLTGTINLPFKPEALDIAGDGSLYCGGEGQLAKLNSLGEVLLTANVPTDVLPGSQESAVAPTVEKGQKKQAPQRRRRTPRPKHISGIALTDQDVFVAFGTGWSLGSKSKLYRFDLDLKNPLALAEGLRGCCQRCDIKALNDVLYLAENSAHRVVQYARDGSVLGKWGERGRNDLKTFGACCNPMNICFDNNGVMYTAESGLGRIKRYTVDGQFLDLVGYVGTDRFWNGSGLAASCSNIAIAVTGDGDRVYVMDYKNSQIRVLQRKGAQAHAQTR